MKLIIFPILSLVFKVDAIGDMDAVFHPLLEGEGSDANNPREVSQIINFTF